MMCRLSTSFISIPIGAVKRPWPLYSSAHCSAFQFQSVRLKVLKADDFPKEQIFQFQSVRLKESANCFQCRNVKFQFQSVRLKATAFGLYYKKLLLFQFQSVRLKAKRKFCEIPRRKISIPIGAVKSLERLHPHDVGSEFQFQSVRLKA